MIRFKNVVYGNILNEVSFCIEKSKYNVITGENGSGKSTAAKLIIGLMKVNSGEIVIDGERLEYSRKKLFEVRKKIGAVFKEIDEQIVGTTVLESLLFGMENNRIDPQKMKENIEKYCEKFEIRHLLERKISELSGGEKQKVAIASAAAVEPEVLILDEALEMLDGNNKKNVKKFLLEYVKAGNTVISITHDIEEIRDSGKIIFIEKNGAAIEIEGLKKLEELENKKNVENFQKMWKSAEKENRAAENIGKSRKAEADAAKTDKRNAVIELRNVNYFYNKENKIIRNLSLSIIENEINAIVGKSGSGKTTLIELMSGLLPLNNFSGEIAVKNYSENKKSTAEGIKAEGHSEVSEKIITEKSREKELSEIRKSMAVLFQDVEKQFFESTVLEEIEYNISKKAASEKSAKEKREAIGKLMNEVGLNEGYLEKSPFELSDGEKKLVGIAMVLATNPRILFLDEPTVNLDPEMAEKILEILKKLKKKKVTVILATHDRRVLRYAGNIIEIGGNN